MKMAKATDTDLEAALELYRTLDALSTGYLPDGITEYPDADTAELYEDAHAAKCIEHLINIYRKGSLLRVAFGMTVILDPRNELVDPNAHTLEVHPKFEKQGQHLEYTLATLHRIANMTDREGNAIEMHISELRGIARAAVAHVTGLPA